MPKRWIVLLLGFACAAGAAELPHNWGFEANGGQSDPAVRFLQRGSRYALFLTAEGAVLNWNDAGPSVLRMKFVSANPTPRIIGQDALPARNSFFIGSDADRWVKDIPVFAKVRYERLYPGIDLLFYNGSQGIEYDFEIAPYASPDRIRIRFDEAAQARMDPEGNLSVGPPGGSVRIGRPAAYQMGTDHRRRAVFAEFARKGGDIGLKIGKYDPALPLIIDPVLSFSTYLGGSGADSASAIALDSQGNAYVAGSTMSANFPVVGAMQATERGAQNIFVSKLNASGSAYVYSTFLGGSGFDTALGIAVDSAGFVCVTGSTTSADFPLVSPLQASLAGAQNAFVAKLNTAGSGMVYSTYLGGGGKDQGNAVAADSAGNCYVAGTTNSPNFPAVGAWQPALAGSGGGSDAFLTKINPTGAAFVYSTYLGGSGDDAARGVAVDAAANVYLVGETASTDFPLASPRQAVLGGGKDAFIAKFNAAGSALVYSTFLGGAANDTGRAISVGQAGNAYVAGDTSSLNFPLANAFQAVSGGGSDAFVAEVSGDGTGLVYSTYLGGSGDEFGRGIAVDGAGNAFVTGDTNSPNFPLSNALQSAPGGGRDAFAAELGATGSALLYSTYLGGANDDIGSAIASDLGGNVTVAGSTSSLNFPAASALQQSSGAGDAFISRIVFPQNAVPVMSMPSSLPAFGAQFLGTTSAPARVTLTNNGLAPLNIYSLTVQGDFQQSNNCGSVLAPGASCSISVTFRPSVGGFRAGAVTVNDNAAGTPHILGLNGNAVAPAPQIGWSMIPPSAAPGSAGFTLRVNGSGYVPGAVVSWNGSPRLTTYISTTQLNAQILPSDLATAGTAVITVANPVQFGPTLSNRAVFLTGTGRGVTVSQWPQPGIILYNREDPNQCDQVHAIAPDGTGDQCLTCGVGGFNGGTAFHNGKLSPDGKWVLMQVTIAGSNGCPSVDGSPGSGNNQEVWLASYPNLGATQLRVSPPCKFTACQNLIPIWNAQQTQVAYGNRQAPCVNPGPPSCAMKLAVTGVAFQGGAPSAGATTLIDVNGANPGIVEPWSWKPDGSLIWYSGSGGPHPYPSLNISSVQLSNSMVTLLTPWTGTNVWNEFPVPAPNGKGMFFSSSRTSPGECPLLGCPAPLFALDEINFMNPSGSMSAALTGLNIPGSPDYAGGVPAAANGITLNPTGRQGLLDEEIPGAPKWITMTNIVWPPNGKSNAGYFPIAAPVSGIAFGIAAQPTGAAAGAGPQGLAAGDFNGDGKFDLATANGNANTVSILLGNGDGTFAQHVEVAAGSNVVALAAADFNGDGQLDLIAVNNGSNTISLLAGNGDGSFQPHVDYAVGRSPVSAVAGDFNLDGNLDLAVANQADGTVSILLGQGDGTFQPAASFPAGAKPVSVAAGGLVGFGALDIAVLNSLGPGVPSTVSILRGNGNGAFRPPLAYAVGTASTSLSIADFNGDGKPDLAVTNGGDATVSILLNSGSGAFPSHTDYPSGNGPSSVIAGDFNLDGKTDLIVANAADGTVSMLAGNGNGVFQPRIDSPAAAFSQIVAGDWNGDGRLDLGGANPSAGSVSVLLQTVTRLSSVTLSPASTYGGLSTAANTVTLSGVAPASGATVLLSSSNPAVASVPATVAVAPGASVSANFTITASAVSGPTLVTISATYGGVTKTAALTVLPVALYTLSLSPSAIGGGLPVKNNRVSIGGLAPAGGIVVGLSSAAPAVASPPASVTIPAGQAVSPVFTITTSPVATSKSVTITASYGGVVKTAVLTVNPTSIYGVNLASSSIAAGAVSPGNAVVLNGTAASGGAAVQLSISNPAAAAVPALVTVPAGGYMQTFTITAGAVATPTNVTITASWSGGVATANFIVNPTASRR